MIFNFINLQQTHEKMKFDFEILQFLNFDFLIGFLIFVLYYYKIEIQLQFHYFLHFRFSFGFQRKKNEIISQLVKNGETANQSAHLKIRQF